MGSIMGSQNITGLDYGSNISEGMVWHLVIKKHTHVAIYYFSNRCFYDVYIPLYCFEK